MNIIWDFDGVIADSELIWLENRRVLLNKIYNLDWDLKTTFKHIGGMSDMTKRYALDELGIITSDDFWAEAMDMDYRSMLKGEMIITPNVKEVLKEFEGRQCVATGGVMSKTLEKVEVLGLGEYFNKDIMFTADMVKRGKPNPDVFLLAQESMGWEKNECVIIEDSLVGMQAGIRAGIKTVAFIAHIANKDKYIKNISELGITDVFDDMLELKDFLSSL